jgi:hypothetical protein
VQLEFVVDSQELAKGLKAPAAPAPELDGIAMRPANTLDLLASAAAASQEDALAILLARTSCAATEQMEAVNSPARAQRWLQDQPKRLAKLLTRRFEQLNAPAEIRIRLECSACGDSSVVDLDVVRYFLKELGAAARRLMTEIHELARAYGWNEAAIAAMSGARRTAYLEMLGT